MVGEPLASVLRSGRDVFNSKYTQARRRFSALEPAVFSEFVGVALDPVARALPIRGEELGSWIQAAYDAGLELVGEGLFSGNGSGRHLVEAWKRILPKLARELLQPPEIAIAAVSNAVHNLCRSRGARVEFWIQKMAQVAPSCVSLEQFLQLGQVLAWRAGMAQFRHGALGLLPAMPDALIVQALDLTGPDEVRNAYRRLQADVWFDPSSRSTAAATGLRAVGKIGSFRGFGGEFLVPPTVACGDNQLFVTSGEDAWLLIADVFGHSLHRASRAEFEEARRHSARSPEARVAAGQVSVGGQSIRIDLPGSITSVAVLPHTVAVTSTATHGIQLLAR